MQSDQVEGRDHPDDQAGVEGPNFRMTVVSLLQIRAWVSIVSSYSIADLASLDSDKVW